MQLEHDAGVIVEAAAERSGNRMRATSTPRAARKPVRLSKRSSAASSPDAGIAREGAQLRCRLVGIAAHRQKPVDQPRTSAAASVLPKRRLFQKSIRDLPRPNVRRRC